MSVVLIFAITIAALEACAQYNLKKNSSSFRVAMGVALYSAVALVLWKSYSHENIGHMNLMWNCLSTIIAFTSGYLFFSEKFNAYTCAAITLALASLYTAFLSRQLNHKNVP